VQSPRLDIYCMAIGGTGMAPLACLLQEQGHCVRGTDGPLYPPMSTLLARCGIEPSVGYDPAHLEPVPDLVVVGNAIHRSNPEAVAAESRHLPLLSMPQALARFFLAERRPLVVTGTHGKTTTSALASWVYSECGADPGYLIGGLPWDLSTSFRAGHGERFIVEGDEYNAAYFDRGAKFLHYRAETVILTSVEYDHADLYPTPEALRDAYAQLISQLPASGLLIACGDTAEVRALAQHAPCRVVLYGFGPDNDLRPQGDIDATPEVTRFTLDDPEAGAVAIELAIAGEHNVSNALAVWAVARRDGLSAPAVAAAMARFHGVRRRLEEIGTVGGVTIVDDFAHHPTAVGKTLAALAQTYPGRRLVALFEPRSLTAGRRFFADGYRSAFRGAGLVLFAPIFHRARLRGDEQLDLTSLATDLQAAGVPAMACSSTEDLLTHAVQESRPGDLVVTMSSGSFDNMPRRLLTALSPPASAPSSSPSPPNSSQ
jgi:UDP-N-acetylmuramate: L-alanyl-gamma-D-glutamyl-meso-diaminopimelate ligase